MSKELVFGIGVFMISFFMRTVVDNYDKEGRYIPICTKNVFFKYYTQNSPSLFFWGEADRRDYVEALNVKISPYYKQDNNDDTTIPNLTNGNYDTEESAF